MMEVDEQPPPLAVEEPPPPQVHEEKEGVEEDEEEEQPAPAEEGRGAHSHRRTPRRATEGIKPWMVQDDVEEELSDPNAGKRPCRLCRVSKVRCDRGDPCSRCVRLGLDCQEQEKQRRGGGQTARAHGHGHGHGRKGSMGVVPSGAGSHGGAGRRRRANSVSSLPVDGLGLHEHGETGSVDDELGSRSSGGSGSTSGRGKRGAKAPRRQQQQQQGQQQHQQLPHEAIAELLGMPSTAATANSCMLVPSARKGGPRSVASGHTTGSESSSVSGGGLAVGVAGGGGYLMCMTVTPTQVLLDTFTKLHAQGRVCRGKTLTVMCVHVLSYLVAFPESSPSKSDG